jgi:hypothetical protein
MIDVPVTAELLPAVAELEPTERGVRLHRLPAAVRSRDADPQLLAMEGQPSGVVIALETTAARLELVLHPSRIAYRGAPRPRGRVDVIVDGDLVLSDELTGGDAIEVDFSAGEPTFVPGPDHTTTVELPPSATPRRVEFWLPHNEGVELIAVRADAEARPARDDRPVWLHHGSSISHGSAAATPTGIWPAVAARRAGVRLHNLGFGGSAMVDPFLARMMRDTPADLISVKLGINVVNGDVMRRRAFEPAVHGFLDTVRDGHPDTPLVLVSPIFCGIHEHAPGPGIVDPASLGTDQVRFGAADGPTDVARGQLDLTVIREVMEGVVGRRGDANLRYLDGRELYGEADAAELPLPDGLHPDPATHELIGRRFAERVFTAR